MELAVPYTKKRAEFGHHIEFDDVPTQILSTVVSEAPAPDEYFKRNPCVTTLDTTPLMSEHEVNTDRVSQAVCAGRRLAHGGSRSAARERTAALNLGGSPQRLCTAHV